MTIDQIVGAAILFWVAIGAAAIVTAMVRDHPYLASIVVITLLIPFGGAIGLAWAVAPLPEKKRTPADMPVAPLDNRKPCPYCGQRVNDDAKKCGQCQAPLAWFEGRPLTREQLMEVAGIPGHRR